MNAARVRVSTGDVRPVNGTVFVPFDFQVSDGQFEVELNFVQGSYFGGMKI